MKIYFLLFFILLYGCDKSDNVKTYRLAKQNSQSSIAKSESQISSNLEFSWNAPDLWEKGKKTSMRLASYNVPYSNGVADLSITNFSGDGGGMLSNVNRWRKQLDLPFQTAEEINNNVIIGVSSLGNYEIHKIINDNNKETAFLCSILSIENSTIFVKLISTISGIKELENQFKDFCSSFKYAN